MNVVGPDHADHRTGTRECHTSVTGTGRGILGLKGQTQVLVIGGGVAGLSAALAARKEGVTVELWDAAPQSEAGGNSAYATGTIRTTFDGLADLRRLMPDLSDAEVERADFGEYSGAEFMEDLGRLSGYRVDVDLAGSVVDDSLATWLWLREQGLRYVPMFGRQAISIDGRARFFGGLVVEVSGGGSGLVQTLSEKAERHGVIVRHGVRATELVMGSGSVRGAIGLTADHDPVAAESQCVVIATGGFESNAQWRAAYLGPDWDLAKIRGSRFSNGDGIRMALEVGAAPYGHWSGCHAVAWDANAPQFAGLDAFGSFARHSYPFGILVNDRGRRFFDEGADFRNFTYGLIGREILRQPGHHAWQIFDAKGVALLREEYRGRSVTRVSADTLEELGNRIPALSTDGLLSEIRSFNTSIDEGVPFNPSIKDGLRTQGIAVSKSNWAQPIDTPPFEAFEVECGVSLTYGGVRIDPSCAVLDHVDNPITGLYAAGQSVGGLLYENVPSGTTMTVAAVLGKRAGSAAARRALA